MNTTLETFCLPGLEQPVSRVGLGGCPLGGHGWGRVDDRESIAAVHRALDLGVNLFDTADVYGLGHSERILRCALQARRHQVVIATKFGVRRTTDGRTWYDNSPRYAAEALEASLKRLGLECIPLYYVHWPDGRTPIEDTLQQLDRFCQQGKIAAIGVSNFSPEQLEAACRITRISAVQVSYSLIHRQAAERLRGVVTRHAIPLVTWGSLAQGLLTGKFSENSGFADDDRRRRYPDFQPPRWQQNLRWSELLRRLAAKRERSAAQMAIRWLLDMPHVGAVLFGAKRAAQVEENVAAAHGWRLSEEDHRLLAQFHPQPVPRQQIA